MRSRVRSPRPAVQVCCCIPIYTCTRRTLVHTPRCVRHPRSHATHPRTNATSISHAHTLGPKCLAFSPHMIMTNMHIPGSPSCFFLTLHTTSFIGIPALSLLLLTHQHPTHDVTHTTDYSHSTIITTHVNTSTHSTHPLTSPQPRAKSKHNNKQLTTRVIYHGPTPLLPQISDLLITPSQCHLYVVSPRSPLCLPAYPTLSLTSHHAPNTHQCTTPLEHPCHSAGLAQW